MLASIEQIVERLVSEYDPDRIILFGSRAAGSPCEDSDIDLVVVKETEARPLDRRIEVERLLSDRLAPLDIHVYTPAEVRALFSIGDPFTDEVIEKGKVVYMRQATAAGYKWYSEWPCWSNWPNWASLGEHTDLVLDQKLTQTALEANQFPALFVLAGNSAN